MTREKARGGSLLQKCLPIDADIFCGFELWKVTRLDMNEWREVYNRMFFNEFWRPVEHLIYLNAWRQGTFMNEYFCRQMNKPFIELMHGMFSLQLVLLLLRQWEDGWKTIGPFIKYTFVTTYIVYVHWDAWTNIRFTHSVIC